MVRDVFERRENLEREALVFKLDDHRESRTPGVGRLDQLERVGKRSLKLGQERPGVDERVAAVKVEIE